MEFRMEAWICKWEVLNRLCSRWRGDLKAVIEVSWVGVRSFTRHQS